MMTIDIEGNRTRDEVMKRSGKTIGLEASHCGSGKVGSHDGASTLPQCGFESARVVELRPFEFCRIRLGLRVRYGNGLERKEVKGAVREFILAMVAREEAAIVNGEYTGCVSAETIDILDRCTCRFVFVKYGLTLKAAKKFESHQVDIMEEIPISDGSDISVEFEKLSDELDKELGGEKDRIRGIGKETGI